MEDEASLKKVLGLSKLNDEATSHDVYVICLQEMRSVVEYLTNSVGKILDNEFGRFNFVRLKSDSSMKSSVFLAVYVRKRDLRKYYSVTVRNG